MKPAPSVTAKTIVKATCPNCGDVTLRATAVTVRPCLTTGRSGCSLRCPACGTLVQRDLEGDVEAALIRAGAGLVAWTLPAELSEAKSGPPLRPDDLLEFHLALDSPASAEELDYLRQHH